MKLLHLFSIHKSGERHSKFVRMEVAPGEENATSEEIRDLEDLVRSEYTQAEVKYLALAEDAGYMQRNRS